MIYDLGFGIADCRFQGGVMGGGGALEGEGDDPEDVAADGRHPEEPIEVLKESEQEDQDGEVAGGGGIDEALQALVAVLERAEDAAKDDGKGEDSPQDGTQAQSEPKRGGELAAAHCPQGEAGEDCAMNDLVADQVDPFAEGRFFEGDAGEFAVDAVDDGGELEEEGGGEGGGGVAEGEPGGGEEAEGD